MDLKILQMYMINCLGDFKFRMSDLCKFVIIKHQNNVIESTQGTNKILI